MKFDVEHRAPFPPERLFEAHRDAFPAIAQRLDEVKSVRERSRASGADGVVVVRNRWQGSRLALPLLFRPLVPEQVLVWEDESRFDRMTLTCTWRITIPGLGPMADVHGEHRYLPDDDGTRLVLDGTFDFRPERAPQMVLPPGAAPIVERMVVGLIVPLLKKSGAAMSEHLAAVDAAS
jgi:hypothetical protein